VAEVNTKYIEIDPGDPNQAFLAEGGEVLRRGGLVAFPTETVYGLGANALNGEAVKGIFVAKGRPSDNPLIVHVAEAGWVGEIAKDVPPLAEILMKTFWPGPLTIILPAGEKVPQEVTAGLATVALRMPDHPVALGLIKAAGVPVAAPSANTSGRPSPTTAKHVKDDLDGRIDLLLDGGPTGVGLESTVLDLTVEPPLVLRPGGVTPEEIKEAIGRVEVKLAGSTEAETETEPPRSPGMKYIHYAPKAPLHLFEGAEREVALKIIKEAQYFLAKGHRVGILSYEGGTDYTPYGQVLLAGNRKELKTVAATLYGVLRRFDELGVDVILAEGVEEEGIGLAVMNRLRKAASRGSRFEVRGSRLE
jgi:L-threonylcarbamoyladenylate synthase